MSGGANDCKCAVCTLERVQSLRDVIPRLTAMAAILMSVNAELGADAWRIVDGKLEVGSTAALKKLIDNVGTEFIVLRTSPPTIWHQKTGQLITAEPLEEIRHARRR